MIDHAPALSLSLFLSLCALSISSSLAGALVSPLWAHGMLIITQPDYHYLYMVFNAVLLALCNSSIQHLCDLLHSALA